MSEDKEMSDIHKKLDSVDLDIDVILYRERELKSFLFTYQGMGRPLAQILGDYVDNTVELIVGLAKRMEALKQMVTDAETSKENEESKK